MSAVSTREPWPIAIAAVFLLVIAVNFGFLAIAVYSAPEIDPSYTHATHR